MVAVFTLDIEEWSDALHISNKGHTSYYVLHWLEPLLKKHNIHPIAYCLEGTENWISDAWERKTHGRYHRWWENADRRPYQWLGFTGGFWFRFLPYWFVKGQIMKHGMAYFHLHDFDLEHPDTGNFWMNVKRAWGLENARKKLEKLLQEVKFE